MLLKVLQPAEIVKPAVRKAVGEANRYINIARIGLPAGSGAEQGNAHHAGSAEFLFLRFQGAYHLVAAHGSILPMPFRPVKALVKSTILHREQPLAKDGRSQGGGAQEGAEREFVAVRFLAGELNVAVADQRAGER